jgi:hypothetical protein
VGNILNKGVHVMQNDDRNILPGNRVLAFDTSLYVDDKKTPLSFTMREGTVLCRYGCRSTYNTNWTYPDMVDVLFDWSQKVSKGHFTTGVNII